MIARLDLVAFKGFEKYTATFCGKTCVLIGPNNAGKSTIIGALRLCAALINHAKRRKPTMPRYDEARDRKVRAYELTAGAAKFVDENVHHEFRETEARLELHFKNGAVVFVVWPPDDDPYFYLEHIPGAQPRDLKVTQRDYPSLSAVQTLTPLEHREPLLSEKTVRANAGNRLASKHFRNHLHLLRQEDSEAFDSLIAFIREHTPEINSLEVYASSFDSPEIDLYLTEEVNGTEKEIYWAGDGLQIWLQLLFHTWRNRDCDTLIFDEPDVYLHPDLQRRLIRVLEDLDKQVVIATHAAELLAEATRDSLIIIDRRRRRSRRVTGEAALNELNDALGSGFNLRIAKALRSRLVLFTDTNDQRVLSTLAKKVGATKLARESGLSLIPLERTTKSNLPSSFGLLNRTVLDSSVEVHALLDSGDLTNEAVADLMSGLTAEGVRAKFWHRHELENYLLVPNLIARVSGLDEGSIVAGLHEAQEYLKEEAFARLLVQRSSAVRSAKGSSIFDELMTEFDTADAVRKEFEVQWAQPSWRIERTSGRAVLRQLNRAIAAIGGTLVSARHLASRIRPDEIDDEVIDYLLAIEDRL